MRRACLTIMQPFAQLIFAGIKVHETRTWRCPNDLLGQRLLIHAGAKRFDTDSLPSSVLSISLTAFGDRLDDLPYGAMLGSVLVVDCKLTHRTDPADKKDRTVGDWRRGRWAWQFSEPREFKVPRPIRGAQGIWYCERPDVFTDDPR